MIAVDAGEQPPFHEVTAELPQQGACIEARVDGTTYWPVEEYKAIGMPRGSRLLVMAPRNAVQDMMPANNAYHRLKGSLFRGPIILARINHLRDLKSPLAGRDETSLEMNNVLGWLTAETTIKTWMDVYTNDEISDSFRHAVIEE